MYKVFFKDKVVFLNKASLVTCQNVKITVLQEVDTHAKNFLCKKQEKDICFIYPNPDELFEYFKLKMTYIRTAGGMVFNLENRFLAIHRLGRWDLPKGKIEKGEKKREAAIREVEEECGITAPKIIRKLPVTYHFYKLKEGEWALKKCHWYLMRYEGNEKLKPQKKESIEKCKWIKINDKGKVLNDTYGAIKDVINSVI